MWPSRVRPAARPTCRARPAATWHRRIDGASTGASAGRRAAGAGWGWMGSGAAGGEKAAGSRVCELSAPGAARLRQIAPDAHARSSGEARVRTRGMGRRFAQSMWTKR
eukprot:scaffold3942_cov123-Isochrysis_galbana.AAC.2